MMKDEKQQSESMSSSGCAYQNLNSSNSSAEKVESPRKQDSEIQRSRIRLYNAIRKNARDALAPHDSN